LPLPIVAARVQSLVKSCWISGGNVTLGYVFSESSSLASSHSTPVALIVLSLTLRRFCIDHSIIHLSTALHSFFGPCPLLRFRNHFYTVSRIPWTSTQPAAWPVPTHRTTQTQNKRTHRHPCLEWDSNTRSQRSIERRLFAPQTAQPL
jgi:hypothetical protein